MLIFNWMAENESSLNSKCFACRPISYLLYQSLANFCLICPFYRRWNHISKICRPYIFSIDLQWLCSSFANNTVFNSSYGGARPSRFAWQQMAHHWVCALHGTGAENINWSKRNSTRQFDVQHEVFNRCTKWRCRYFDTRKNILGMYAPRAGLKFQFKCSKRESDIVWSMSVNARSMHVKRHFGSCSGWLLFTRALYAERSVCFESRHVWGKWITHKSIRKTTNWNMNCLVPLHI